MKSLIELERDVITMLLDGDHPILTILRDQYSNSDIIRREMTGVGFYSYFGFKKEVKSLLDDNPLIRSRFWISDVSAQIINVENGAGFVLWIIDGCIHQLEGYVYTESWPDNIVGYQLSYIGGARKLNALVKGWEKCGS